MVHRHELTDQQWERIEPLLPPSHGRTSTRGDRQFLNAVVWIAKTGAPWRDLPERYGSWKTNYNRFRNWATREVWHDIFKAISLSNEDVDGILDASVVRAHQDSSGGKGGPKKTR